MASMQKVEENVNRIEEKLGKLYLDSLLLISEIHKNGRTRYSRSSESFLSLPLFAFRILCDSLAASPVTLA